MHDLIPIVIIHFRIYTEVQFYKIEHERTCNSDTEISSKKVGILKSYRCVYV